MAVLPLLIYPDERLKQVAIPVTQFDGALQAFIKDLEDTMCAGPGGVGIAAPQVGKFQRIAIVDVSTARRPVPNNGRLLLINPEILAEEGEVKGREGCMSVPDYTGNVIRARSIRLKAQDEQGQWREYQCEGFEARAVLHEIDHLEGLLFLDRLVSRRNDLFRRKNYLPADRPAKS